MKNSKIVKVSAIPQNGGYVPAVRVAGKILEQNGFELGQMVSITANADFILIKKVNRDISPRVQEMIMQNNNLLHLIETFDLCEV